MSYAKSAIITLLLVTSIFGITACVTPEPIFKEGYKPAPESLTIMTYNVENLFDTEDDAGKKDEAYLPIEKKDEAIKARCRIDNSQEYRRNECLTTDWSVSKLDRKMQRLTDVLKKVRGGKGPDILIVQEVENRNVLEIWRKKYLAEMGYKPAVLVEGPDERGIDVGVISRLDIQEPLNLHVLKFTANEKLKPSDISSTRGILEATVRLTDGSLLTVLGVHLPSQGNPSEMRRQALESVQKVKDGLPKDRLVVVGGDFNISSDEEAEKKYFKEMLAKNWNVSHLVGCKNCEGTYYYRRNNSWSFFDVLLTSKNMLPGSDGKWKIVPESIRIENNSLYQNNQYGNPARFDASRKDGVSDHWPLALEIIQEKQTLIK
ncbi:MAG: hypothetical protein IT287_08555 [Bdellovibrionaceae bacterium]|nr:hypothetical protein [Pseudobdellovibrionaceae bacterium]